MRNVKITLFVILIIAAVLRFYKLDWGSGNFFHPDERNIAAVALSIKPPIDYRFFTKGTFSYGSLIPYGLYFINLFHKFVFPDTVNFDQFKFYIISFRFISAFFSLLTVFLIYLIGKKFWNEKVGLLSAGLLTFSAGAIQAAHFGTFESTLTFFYLLIFYFFLGFWQTKRLIYFNLSALFLIISSAIKINSIVFLPILILGLFFFWKKTKIQKIIMTLLLLLIIFPLFTVLLSPYYLTPGFWGMLNYERGVVTGILDVFYTKEFINSIPVWFQMTKILPFIINPLFVIIFPLVLLVFIFSTFKKVCSKQIAYINIIPELLLLAFLVLLFFPNAFLYSKWTRYMVSSIPFFLLMLIVIMDKWEQKISKMVLYLLIIINTLWGLSFMSVYFHKDVRITASRWMYDNIEKNAVLLNETANVIDIPIPETQVDYEKNFNNIIFDFYGLPYNKELVQKLVSDIEEADYIIIPSRRIADGMARFPDKYPIISKYYKLLYSGELGFLKIKDFTSYPKLGAWEFDDELAEETWSVFDHPHISVWKKIVQYPSGKYDKLFNK